MSIFRSAVLSLAVTFALGVSAQAATKFIATLAGAQENPPVASNAGGFATAMLNDLGGDFSLDYSVTISSEINFVNFDAALDNGANNNASGFHIHNAPRGINGGVVYGIFGPDHDRDDDVIATLGIDGSTTFTGTWGVADGSTAGNLNGFGPGLLAAGLGDVDLYFNIHTPVSGSGEIRGQLVAVPEPNALMLLGLGVMAIGILRRR